DTAARFDARNGTGNQSALIRERLDAVPLEANLPLLPTPRPAPIPPSRKSTVDNPDLNGADSPDAVLDLAEEHLRRGRRELAFGVWHAFDERYAAIELTPRQRGRRADGHGVEAANGDALTEAETAWRSAVALYAEAGDEVRRQGTRGRIG